MIYAIKMLVGFLLPPGLFVMLLFAASLAYRSSRPLAAISFAVGLVLYMVSIPLTGDALMRRLESRYTPTSPSHGDVLVMLGAGATLDTPNVGGLGNLSGSGANRLLAVADLYRLTQLPIIVSGGQVFPDDGNEAQIAKRQLLLLGVPSQKIILEDKSKNTVQNAVFTNRLLHQYGYHHPVLITSAFHMQRAVLDFQHAGVSVIPYPTDFQTSLHVHLYANQFVPSAQALSTTATALHEYLGILALRLGLPS